MSAPAISGPVDMPSAEHYVPADLGDGPEAAAVQAAKELLGWMRHAGIRCQAISVGGVQVHGIEDDFPRKRPTPPAQLTDRDLFDE